MTIANETQRTSYTGTGVTTALPVGFKFYASSELVVTKRVTASGAETVLSTSLYSVTGGDGATGTVTPVSGSDFPTTVTWTITRAAPKTQLLNTAQNSAFPANPLNS